MTDLFEYAKRAAVRKVVYVVVGALLAAIFALFGGKARAQTGPIEARYFSTAAEAWAACETTVEWYVSNYGNGQWVNPRCQLDAEFNPPRNGEWGTISGMISGWYSYANSPGTDVQAALANRYFEYGTKSCPNGTTWNEATKKCATFCDVGSWPDPSNPGQCLDSQKCQARNNTLGVGNWVSTGPSRYMCESGCDYGFKPGESGKVEVGQGGTTSTRWTGQTYYTGQSCDWRKEQNSNVAPPELAQEEKQQPDPNQCTPIDGQTVCVKPDGNMCASASNGKEFCWSPHSTGEKTADNKLQTKKPGNQQGPASIGLPNGDTANKEGPETTVTQTTKDGRTSTTTVSNYTTASGANAGTSNSGQTRNPDGTVKPGPNDGKCEGDDCDDEKNESTGGEDCDTPPQSSGDAILAQVARQAWETRCEFRRSGEAVKDYHDQLKAENDAADSNVARSDVWANGSGEGNGLNEGLVSFGSSCPAPPVMALGDQTFTWPSGFCETLAMIRLLVIAAGMVAAVRIVART